MNPVLRSAVRAALCLLLGVAIGLAGVALLAPSVAVAKCGDNNTWVAELRLVSQGGDRVLPVGGKLEAKDHGKTVSLTLVLGTSDTGTVDGLRLWTEAFDDPSK